MATDPGAFDRLPHQLEHPSARTVLGQLQQPQQPQHHPRPNNGDAPQRQRGPGELALAAVAAAAASAEGVGFGGPSQLRMEAGTPPVKVESRMESRMEDVTPTSVGGIPAAPSPTPTSPASPPGGAPLTPTLGDSRMASVGPGGGSSVGSPGNAYKRASRRGAVKRFTCEYEGCEKVYSRFEHLQRHQLNREFLRLGEWCGNDAGGRKGPGWWFVLSSGPHANYDARTQTTPNKSTAATLPDATSSLYGTTCFRGTRSGTIRRTCRGTGTRASARRPSNRPAPRLPLWLLPNRRRHHRRPRRSVHISSIRHHRLRACRTTPGSF